ncbi:MAG: ceramidase domain-containing protein [Polyangiaceae bacterium]
MVASPWTGFEPGHIGFCEARLDGWIVEPANAWSSLAYLAVGAYLTARARRRGDAPLLLVGTTAILVGLGSFAFHATATFFGEFADEGSMFLIGALMGTLALRRIFAWSFNQCACSFALMVATSLLVLARAHGSGLVVFALQVVLAASLEIRLWRSASERGDYRALKVTLGLFGGAYIVWWLDFGQMVCNPTNHVFGGHAVWHALTALSLVSYQLFQEQFIGSVRVPTIAVLPALPAPEPSEPDAMPSAVESLRAIRAQVLSAPESSAFR